jgi:hypothetical protein
MIQDTDFVDVDEHIGSIEPDAIHIMAKSVTPSDTGITPPSPTSSTSSPIRRKEKQGGNDGAPLRAAPPGASSAALLTPYSVWASLFIVVPRPRVLICLHGKHLCLTTANLTASLRRRAR